MEGWHLRCYVRTKFTVGMRGYTGGCLGQSPSIERGSIFTYFIIARGLRTYFFFKK